MKRAFTLIELLVVIVVMIILMAATLPAIKSLTRNNAQKQAVNQITAMLANARATAIQQRKIAGLVIYEDPELVGQSSTQLIIRTSTIPLNNSSGTLMEFSRFSRVQRSTPQPLPKGIVVGMLDDNSTTPVRTGDSSSNTKSRVILFNENGQLVLMNGLQLEPTVTDAAAVAWNLNATSSNPARGVSNPGVIVFSEADMKAATDRGVITNSSNRAQWVQQNADILIVNAYTGNIIR